MVSAPSGKNKKKPLLPTFGSTPGIRVSPAIPNLSARPLVDAGQRANLAQIDYHTKKAMQDETDAFYRLQEDADEAAVLEEDRQAAVLKAQLDGLKAKQNLRAALMPPQQAMPEQTPMPQRPNLAPPIYEGPRQNPMGSLVAGLVDAFVPGAGGRVGAASLDAAREGARQQYQNRVNEFNMLADQISQRYEDELAARNETMRYNLLRAATGYQNQKALYDHQKDSADLQGDIEGINQQVGVLENLAPLLKEHKRRQNLADKQKMRIENIQGALKNTNAQNLEVLRQLGRQNLQDDRQAFQAGENQLNRESAENRAHIYNQGAYDRSVFTQSQINRRDAAPKPQSSVDELNATLKKITAVNQARDDYQKAQNERLAFFQAHDGKKPSWEIFQMPAYKILHDREVAAKQRLDDVRRLMDGGSPSGGFTYVPGKGLVPNP